VATVTGSGLPRDQTHDGNDFRLVARPGQPLARSGMASYISFQSSGIRGIRQGGAAHKA
jgi:hypothetical protein